MQVHNVFPQVNNLLKYVNNQMLTKTIAKEVQLKYVSTLIARNTEDGDEDDDGEGVPL